MRILRVARFAARYAPLGFRIAGETLALMRQMVENGEVDHLVAERVWQELRRALEEPKPSAFVATLRDCGALARLLPEVDALYGVPQRPEFHPEVDTGIHTQMVVDMAARIAPGDALVGFCALVHDLGKALTPQDQLPRHVGHEHAGVAPIRAVCSRLRTPAEFVELAVLCCRLHLQAHTALQLRPATVVKLFEMLDAFRKPARVESFLRVCEADKRGRLGMEDSAYPQGDYLRIAFAAAATVGARDFVAAGLDGPAIGEAVRRARVAAVAALRQDADDRGD